MCLFTNIFRLLLDKIRTRKQVIISKKYLRNLEEKALFLKSITTLSYFLYDPTKLVGCESVEIMLKKSLNIF